MPLVDETIEPEVQGDGPVSATEQSDRDKAKEIGFDEAIAKFDKAAKQIYSESVKRRKLELGLP